MEDIIRHQFSFSHPPESVWEYLTKPELMELWLMKNNFEPVVGTSFQFQTSPEPGMDFDGIFYCKVLELIPHSKLSYSWSCGPGDGRITLDSIVTWTLIPNKNGTELFLEHRGFTNKNLNIYNALNHGWVRKFTIINNLLNNIEHVYNNAGCVSNNR